MHKLNERNSLELKENDWSQLRCNGTPQMVMGGI